MINFKKIWLISLVLIFPFVTALERSDKDTLPNIYVTQEAEAWSDSVYNSMSLRERVGQLFVAGALTSESAENLTNIKNLVTEYKVGGFILSKGTAQTHFNVTEYAQSLSKIPLMITIDGEWGLAMRLTDTPKFPRNIVVGAANDEGLAFEYGKEVGRQCKQMGIHVNFAPDIDVNSNPKNPVIGTRSYGDNPDRVARLGIAYSRGLLAEGILPVGKHFPGHGDVESDSHKTLPVNNKNIDKLYAEELYPFNEYIKSGMPSIMAGHLFIPALDSVSGLPTSLSNIVVTSLLKEKLGFDGLIFTDALEMKGATAENSALKALMAGNHVLLKPLNVGECMRSIENAIKNGSLSEHVLKSAVKRVLAYKYKFVGKDRSNLSDKGLTENLNSEKSKEIIYSIYSKGITLLKNDETIPFKNINDKKISVECYGSNSTKYFTDRIKSYGISESGNDSIKIIGVYSGKSSVVAKVESACKSGGKFVLVFFTSPYNMKQYSHLIERAEAVVMAYEEEEVAQECAAEILMGGIGAQGKLPVNATPYKRGDGLNSDCIRLGYAPAGIVKLDGVALGSIDSIVIEGLKAKAYPGCQVLIAKDGKIVYEKVFGKVAGENSRDVRIEDIYDLASVTKCAATTPSLMYLHSVGMVDIEKPLRNFMAIDDTLKVGDIPLKELLWHESGLPPGINPNYFFTDTNSYEGNLYSWRNKWPHTLQIEKRTFAHNKAKLRKDLVSAQKNDTFNVRVCNSLWAHNAIVDTIINHITMMQPDSCKKYRYSDLNFILLQRVVENLSGSKLNDLADSLFYAPLGMTRTTYKPLDKFAKWEVIPTERDNFLRKELMQGYTHDETASFMGNVSGNAGLFGNARDLAKLLQMLLNGGVYGGERFMTDETVNLFTQTLSSKSRRALGFDKPDMTSEAKSPCAPDSPVETFGHTGYTGTAFWADQKNNMIFIFISNRVHPHRWNGKLMQLNIRPRIQNITYEAMRLYEE